MGKWPTLVPTLEPGVKPHFHFSTLASATGVTGLTPFFQGTWESWAD